MSIMPFCPRNKSCEIHTIKLFCGSEHCCWLSDNWCNLLYNLCKVLSTVHWNYQKKSPIQFGCHQGYVRNRDLSQPTGRHFSANGHSIADMRVCIVEKVYSFDRLLIEERESEFIRKFNSKFKGMNVNSWIALLYVFVMLLFVPHRYLSTLKPQILWLSCTRLMMKL